MKVATWNCNMAFRKKAKFILRHAPDILVVPECEHIDKMKAEQIGFPTSSIWYGSNKNKGLAVFSFNDFNLQLLDFHNPDFKTILPISVSNGLTTFLLIAIWANNPSDPDGCYVEQVWKAVNFYANQIRQHEVMLIGDFNSNTIWDKKSRIGNHSHLVSFLESMHVHSCFHHYYSAKQGAEENPTFYLQRNRTKPYHIDYCFASDQLLSKLTNVEIGLYEDWIVASDHMPLIVNITL